MEKHTKKLIAPIIISVLFILYYGGFFLLCLFVPVPAVVKLLLVLIPLLLAGVMVYVLIVRVKEIRSGEEDDLSKY